MALPVNIDDLINARTVESVRIEFKRGWNPFDILRTVCAFANDIDELGGGYVLIGLEEQNGTPIMPPFGVEQKDIDGIQREFFKLCKDNIDPNIFPSIEIIEFQGKFIIVIWITTGELRPYSASSSLAKGARMAIYVRHGSITKEADENQERQLRELAAFKHFDDRINQKASIDNLDLGLIQSYLQEIKSDLYVESLKIPLVEIAIKMQIARGPKENIKPLNVGLLMFCKEPHKFFEGCRTNLIEFEDEAGIKYSEKLFTGPVHLQIRDIMNYFGNNVIKQHVKKPVGKAESDVFFNYPYQALEEAVVNAMYHRSYEEQRPNEIRIYKIFKPATDNAIDKRRIEIRSYPGPMPPIDSQALSQLEFTSRNYRNIKLGDWLKNIRLAEKYATGIPTILQTLSENGSPNPTFWTDESKSEFLVMIKIHEDSPYNGDSYVVKVEHIALSNIQQKILEKIKTEPMSQKKLRSQFSENISKDIHFLEENGYIGKKKMIFSTLLYISQKGVDALKVSF
ncbi:MAG: putative DNA binding domain-containing protein [Bacteroidales bacterium]|nr:putative DNA binding domain-containing protein [Bacteroidales bacterium]